MGYFCKLLKIMCIVNKRKGGSGWFQIHHFSSFVGFDWEEGYIFFFMIRLLLLHRGSFYGYGRWMVFTAGNERARVSSKMVNWDRGGSESGDALLLPCSSWSARVRWERETDERAHDSFSSGGEADDHKGDQSTQSSELLPTARASRFPYSKRVQQRLGWTGHVLNRWRDEEIEEDTEPRWIDCWTRVCRPGCNRG